MAVGIPQGPNYPGTPFKPFFAVLPLSDRRRVAHSFCKIGRLSSSFPCLFHPRLRLLILLLFLMSGNVLPNPAPIYTSSVCAGNVTWRDESVQCCTCSKWVHLKCSRLSLSKFRTLGSFYFWICPPPAASLPVTL